MRAAGGEEGVALVARERPAVVLLDLLMPGVDGFDVVHRLRADPATASVPIVVLTAKEMSSEDRERLAGQIDYLAQKGAFGRRHLVDLVGHLCAAALGGHRMTDSPLLLIVEDNERNMKLARDLLAHAGYDTLEAPTAEEALALARARRPDMILMDIQLPGWTACRRSRQLRADPATAAIPVVAFTAFAMKDDRERFLDAGFFGYLEKPISVREFPAQVAELLASANGRTRP